MKNAIQPTTSLPFRDALRLGSRVFAIAAIGLVLFASSSQALTISKHGSYTILAGVPKEDAETVHAAAALFGGLSPIYIDAFHYPTTGTLYSSIWKKADGVDRKIFLDWSVDEVWQRMESSNPANQLLQVDAWTQNEGSLENGPEYNPAWYFETHCCGVWTDEQLSERRLEYWPVGGQLQNLYWDLLYGASDWFTAGYIDTLLREQGFEIESATVVRPSFPGIGPGGNKPMDPDAADPFFTFEASGILALYTKNAAPTWGNFGKPLDEAKDYVSQESESGWETFRVEVYQGHPYGAYWSQDPDAWKIKFGVSTRQDDRDHQIAWGFEAKDIDWSHHLMYSGSYAPLSITASRWPDTNNDEVRYTIVYREKDIRVNERHDPADELKDHDGFGDDGTKP